ncbi:MAG: hypothetical protein L6R42_009284, partial [Xanthoria sp. 1 TBL-2021]
SAYYLFEPDYRHYANFHLGYNSPARRENGVGYWDAVADQLEMIMRENPYYERPDKVLLMGDCVHDGDFRAALIEALSNQNGTPNILDHDAAYVAAKGAGELTRRLPWDPYDSKAAGFQAPTARSYGRLRLAEPAQQSDLAMSIRQPPKPVRETSEEDLLLRPHIH